MPMGGGGVGGRRAFQVWNNLQQIMLNYINNRENLRIANPETSKTENKTQNKYQQNQTHNR
jgi:hypothetical protein